MSRIFRISGNFMRCGEWSEPDPSFSGKIVVDNDDEFYGFCDELYSSEEMSEINRVRYLAGAFMFNGRDKELGIAFYKMSNDHEQDPLMYVTPNLKKPNSGSWAALSMFGFFQEQGKAKVTIEDEPYSRKEEEFIKQKFKELDTSITSNNELLKQIHCCKDILAHTE